MIRNLYGRTMALADGPHALWALAVVAFVESSVFPIPPDVLMIPMILARPVARVADRAGRTGRFGSGRAPGLCHRRTGVRGHRPAHPGRSRQGTCGRRIQQPPSTNGGAWAVLIAGVTPFPYKVITIMSGWTGLSIPVFIVSSIVARGLRFFVVAALLWKFGAPIRDLIERRLGLFFTLFVALLLGGFLVLRYL